MSENAMQDIKVPVQVVLGENSLTLAELAALKPGSIVGLTSLAGEPVDFVAAGQKIGKGEVVVIDENFGIRLTNISDEEQV